MKCVVRSVALAVFSVGFAYAASAVTNAPAGGITDAQRYDRFMRKTGGVLDVPGKGWLAVADGQKKASEQEVRYCVQWLGKLLNIQCRYVRKDTPFDVKTARSDLESYGANAVLFFEDDRDLPMSLVAPEGKWAMVNAASFDAGTESVFTNRFEKEVARAAALLLGAGVSQNPISAMKPVFEEKDLDAFKGETWMDDSVPGMRIKIPAMGMSFNGFVTYKEACLAGWAPQPSNEYQRVIWEGVRSGVIKPKKIESQENER